MKWWKSDCKKCQLSGAKLLLALVFLISYRTLSAQPPLPISHSVQTPSVSITHEIFETGNWHRVFIEPDQVRFQNALSDTTITKVDLENYLATHQPGDSAKLAIHLSNTNIESDRETMRLIASSWKCFTFVVVTPVRKEE